MRADAVLALALFSAAGCARRADAQSAHDAIVATDARAAPHAQASATAAPAADPWRTVAPGIRVASARVSGDSGETLEWRVLRLDLARVKVTARAMEHEAVADASADRSVWAAVDGGFFDPDHRPSGLLAVEGRALFPYRRTAGSGALVVRDGVADVIESAAAPTTPTGLELAVQCGPRLVERDGSAGVYHDDGHRWARTAACVRDGGRTLDLIVTWDPAVPLNGPGLYSFSRGLAGPSPVGDARGCERALNLDGGPSTGVFVRGDANASHPAVGPVPWALVISAR